MNMKDLNLYDRHVRGAAREVITTETRIKSTNKGFALLAKMGWTEGTPLGLSGDGIYGILINQSLSDYLLFSFRWLRKTQHTHTSSRHYRPDPYYGEK